MDDTRKVDQSEVWHKRAPRSKAQLCKKIEESGCEPLDHQTNDALVTR